MNADAQILRTTPRTPTVCCTGWPSAGKTMFARAVAVLRARQVVPLTVLGGKKRRATLRDNLNFSRENRPEQVGRAAYLA